MRWGGGGRNWSWLSLGNTRYDYQGRIGDGRGNSIVEAVVSTICRVFGEAPPQVLEVGRDGTQTPVHNHPLTKILKRPNPYYSGVLLWQATLGDWLTNGNAYWAKVRSGDGRVIELWWLPATMVEPKWPEDGSAYLSHYEYRFDSSKEATRLEVADVVHFRNGLDPANPRKGRSPLASVAREIATDDEAANFSAALLRNMAVPGVIISPDAGVSATEADLKEVKDKYMASFGNDNRGAPLVMKGPTRVQVVSFSPQQMDLGALRLVPEARIAAVYGAAAMVVGLTVGLEHSIYANYSEAREALYESNILPTQRLYAADLDTQLLPDFGDPARQQVDFDNSDVRVLQPDLDKLFSRLNSAVLSGWMMPNEARNEVGMDPLVGGDVVYLPGSITPTDPKMLIPPEPEPMPEPLALEEPTPLQALPAPKGRKGFKSRSGATFAESLTRLRERHQAPLERELLAGFARERDELIRRLGMKDTSVVPDPADWLRRVLEKWYRRVLLSVHGAVEDALDASFELGDPLVRAYLTDAGADIVGISETTRRAVAEALQAGYGAGESIPQIAARIRGLTAWSTSRAETISRTELGQAANRAALTSFRASGLVVGVVVFDGHDDEPCRSLAGRRFTLDEARNLPPLGHPNCTRALAPVVDASEMEGAA